MRIEFYGIRLTDKNLMEMDGERPAVKIPLSKIQRITVQNGFQAERPIIGATFGLLLVGFGVVASKSMITWFTHGGSLPVSFVCMVPLIAFGAWIIFKSLKRGYYLSVQTESDRRKLNFTGAVARHEIDDVVRQFESAGLELLCEIS